LRNDDIARLLYVVVAVAVAVAVVVAVGVAGVVVVNNKTQKERAK
jgi:hypothetical protein